MAYFEILLNGNLFARAGSPQARVLTAHVIIGPRGGASFGVHGMSVFEGQRTHSDWPSHFLSMHDEITIALLQDGEATAPLSSTTDSEASVQEQLQKLREEFEEHRERMPAVNTSRPYSFTRAPRSDRLEITVPSGSTVGASLEGAEQLQAVLCFVGDSCKLEVDSLTIQPDGTTRGRRWLHEPIDFGQTVKIAYAT